MYLRVDTGVRSENKLKKAIRRDGIPNGDKKRGRGGGGERRKTLGHVGRTK